MSVARSLSTYPVRPCLSCVQMNVYRIWWIRQESNSRLLTQVTTYICVQMLAVLPFVAVDVASAAATAAASNFYYWPMYRHLICIVFYLSSIFLPSISFQFWTLFVSCVRTYFCCCCWTLVDLINRKRSTHTCAAARTHTSIELTTR